MKNLTELFGEPISVYSDNDAIEDGALVAINDNDRVTRPVWDWITGTMDMKKSQPPSCWPIDLFAYCRAKTPDDRALAMFRGLIDTNRRQALRVYDENIGGGIFTLWINHEGGYGGRPTGVETSDTGGQMKLWFVPNGNGLTLMFPEDY